MRYILSEHARRRIIERKIDLAWVEIALFKPKIIEPDPHDEALEHRLAEIPACDRRVLRVVCDPRQNPLKVVTAFFDRRMMENV